MAVVLLDPPHPWLLPLLVLLVLLEVAAALGKRQWCQALAKEVKGLTIRKVEVMLQMNKLGIPTDFVKKSKLERELIQLDKDLAPRKERLAKQASDYEGKVGKAKYAVHILLVVGLWGTPLLRLSPSATWPLSVFFAFPRLGPGAVGASAAIAMVKAATAPLGPWLASV